MEHGVEVDFFFDEPVFVQFILGIVINLILPLAVYARHVFGNTALGTIEPRFGDEIERFFGRIHGCIDVGFFVRF